MSRKKKNLSSQEMKEEKTIKPDTCHTQAKETTESIEQQETIEATTSENKEKVRYNLSQTLFETGQYGMEEIFTLRGIEEKELKKV